MLESDLNGAIRNEQRILMRKPLVKGPVQDDQKIVKWFLGKHCEDVNMFRRMSSSKLWYLTLSWPAGHICPPYKESFQVRWDNSIPLFIHAAIYLEVPLFRWTSQNAFSRETAAYKWYCVQCCIAALHTVSFVHGCFAGKCILTGSTE